MGGIIAFTYGAICYAVFFVTFLYAIGFVGNFGVPKSIDSGQAGDVVLALLVNLGLMGVFAVQHSLMARPEFKKVWTKVVPESVERSTYVLFSSLALVLLFAYWQPMPSIFWDASGSPVGALLLGLFWIGWATVLASTFMLSHFDLLGLKQVFRRLRGRPLSTPEEETLRTPALYKVVRHPIMLGFLIAFWATPVMSMGHLLFAAVVTVYTVLALILEERDLVAALGSSYLDYRKRVPMLIPFAKRNRSEAE
jgi:methanethiol S-methyltransferase